MLNRASFLAVAAIATLSLAAASPSHAGGSGGDKPKNGQTFKQPGNGSNNTASNSGNSNHKDDCCDGDRHRRHHEKFIVINRYPSYSYPSRPQVVQVPPRPTYVAPAPTCLTKEYLQNSTVMFKDSCTKEWAMNSTTLAAQPVNRACLVKEYPQSGVVLFKDTCTNEWARNPEQQAQGPDASQPR